MKRAPRPKISMKRVIVQPEDKVDNVPPPQLSQQMISLKNQMVHDTIEKATLKEEITPKPLINAPENDQPFLIPINDHDVPENDRVKIYRYLVVIPSCIHPVHTYSSSTRQDMINKSQRFLEIVDYGKLYPIVSKSKLVYCRECADKIDEILKLSHGYGNLNFFSKIGTRSAYSHAKIPDYVSDSIAIQTHGENVWVNLSHSAIESEDVYGVKDAIIVATQRKNFLQVFSLPHPFDKITEKFEDFGTVTFIATASAGYDAQPFMISDEIEFFDDDMCNFSDDGFSGTTHYVELQPEHTQVIDTRPIIHTVPNVDITEVPKAIEIGVQPTSSTILSNHDQQLYNNEPPSPDISKLLLCNETMDETEDEIDTIVPTIPSKFTEVEEYVIPTPPSVLIFNMTVPSDFANNIAYFKKHYNIDVHVATYNYCDLSVNVVTSLDSREKDHIYATLILEGYIVDEPKMVTICINNQIIHRWSFILLHAKKQNVIKTSQGSELENQLTQQLIKNQDRELSPMIQILEKSYYQNQLKKSTEDVIFNFEIESACKNIPYRDVRYLFDHGFASEWNHYTSDPTTHSRLMLMLLVNVLHNSELPSSNITVNQNSIIIKM